MLTESEMRWLLTDVCVKLGFCLPPDDQRRLEQQPPADAESFSDAVLRAEGLDPATNRRLFQDVLDLAAGPFDRAHALLRSRLLAVHEVMSKCGDGPAARQVLDALEQSDPHLRAFLVSNELWGGAGSIADQAGIDSERESRRRIEAALIELGEAQMRAGLINARTAIWVEAFRSWPGPGNGNKGGGSPMPAPSG